jgi:hypothetical protein
VFIRLLCVPDFSMLGYLADPCVGATVYDPGHTLVGPALCLLAE